MKKLFLIAGSVLFFAACNDRKSTDTTNETTTVTADSSLPSTPATTSTTTSTTMSDNNSTSNAYVPAEGDVTYRNGKVWVWRNNNYVVTDRDVTLDNGVVVNRKGEVKRDDKVVQLQDSETVSKSGNFFNKAGEGIDDAWDATKKGVSKAAGAVKKAANKVGEEVKEAVH